MGTPEFAVPTLQKLLQSGNHHVKAVFTKEPKPQNRGMEVEKSPVHKLAEQHDIPIYTPKSLKKAESLEMIEGIDADAIIVVAYGLIIPENILQQKKYGCLNVHPSNLPKYRGAAPLQRAIINNESDTAICIIRMDAGVDTGDIMAKEDFSIDRDMTLSQLHDKCAQIGAELMVDLLDNIDHITPVKQSEEGAVYAHKLSKEEGEINWLEDKGIDIYCKIRGMNPWPGVYFTLNGKTIKILSANWNPCEHQEKVGAVMNEHFDVACLGGILRLVEIKPEGKSAMSGESFLRGNRIASLV